MKEYKYTIDGNQYCVAIEEAGETTAKVTVTFKIDRKLLEFYDYNLNKVAEPGEFHVFIGKDSQTDNMASLKLI